MRKRNNDSEERKFYCVTDLLTVDDAIFLVAKQSFPGGSQFGRYKSGIKQRIWDALKAGKLTKTPTEQIALATLIAWVNVKKDLQLSFRNFAVTNTAHAKLVGPSCSLNASGTAIPNDPAERAVHLIEISTLNHQLQRQVQELSKKNAELKIHEAAVKKRSSDGSINGKKGGRGNAK